MLNSRFANLRSVDLVFAELRDADVRKETDLRGADLDHAGVQGATAIATHNDPMV
jgi:uncharacterized protein YjbI with pentapeptide repeats